MGTGSEFRGACPHFCNALRVVGLVPFVLALFAAGTPAQEINWRYDYNAARKEAAEKHRPLLLDFGTEHCFWCAKLDTTTFKDAEIARLVNEQFVPLKVEAEKNPLLTQTLQNPELPDAGAGRA